MSQEYRMAYRLGASPPKPREALADDEGLTDTLIAVSVVGRPVPPEGGPASAQVYQLGPQGPEPYDPGTCLLVAMALLRAASQSGRGSVTGRAARAGEAAVRSVVAPGSPPGGSAEGRA